jgi:hypothetical protein
MIILNQEDPLSNLLLGIVQSALDLVRINLQRLSTQANFCELMWICFGELDVNQFQETWLRGNAEFPAIEVLPQASIHGFGAFSRQANRIYLAQEFLLANSQNLNRIAMVLIQGYGYFVAAQANPVEWPGDEGSLFAAFVLGHSLTDADMAALALLGLW